MVASDLGQQRPLKLELAISGGGVRAMAFHAGVLQALAERGSLEHVRHISSVSGGSLVVGLIFRINAMRWPSSQDYLATVLPRLREQLTTHDLQSATMFRLLLPWNWRFALSRANVLASAIQTVWDIHNTLADLPAEPIWSINATTAETGRRFRFKASGCGDYQLGYANAERFPLAQALAVSAAFPGAIGPLAIRCDQYEWRKRPHWDATEVEAVRPPFVRLHLYDGGLYDNLGLEPLFDVGSQRGKADGAVIIVSDAGAPWRAGFARGALSPWRIKLWLDLTTEQQRALRIRSFVHALQSGLPGAYLQIGSAAKEQLEKVTHPAATSLPWLSTDQALTAASLPTSLRRLNMAQFDLLTRHGYETVLWNELAYPHNGDTGGTQTRTSSIVTSTD